MNDTTHCTTSLPSLFRTSPLILVIVKSIRGHFHTNGSTYAQEAKKKQKTAHTFNAV